MKNYTYKYIRLIVVFKTSMVPIEANFITSGWQRYGYKTSVGS